MIKFPLTAGLLGAVLLVCSIALSPAVAGGPAGELPGPLRDALTKYEEEDLKGFIAALVRGSPLEGNRELRQKIEILEQIEDYYGSYRSFDLLHVNPLTDSTRLIYFVLNYQRGPVFGTLTAFRSGGRETITSFQFHTKAEQILPDGLLVGR